MHSNKKMQITIIIYIAWQSYTALYYTVDATQEWLFIDILSHSSRAPNSLFQSIWPKFHGSVIFLQCIF